MTRAMRELYLTYAESRRLHGKEVYHRPSRFLREIPAKFLEEMRLKTKVSFPVKPMAVKTEGYLSPGQQVTHKQFGIGTVLQCEGRGEHARGQVPF